MAAASSPRWSLMIETAAKNCPTLPIRLHVSGERRRECHDDEAEPSELILCQWFGIHDSHCADL